MYRNPTENTPLGWLKIIYFNWALFAVSIVICLVGLITLYGVGDGEFNKYTKPQAIRMGIGIVGMFIIAFLPNKLVKFSIIPFYILVIALLVLTFIIGIEVNGSKRWLDVGFMRLQASEFAKLSVALMLAQFFSWLPENNHESLMVRFLVSIATVAVAMIIILIPTGLTFLQPDGGGAVFILLVGLSTMLIAGVNWIYYILGIAFSYFVVMMIGVGLIDYAVERHGADSIEHLPKYAITKYENGTAPDAGNFLTNWIAHKALSDAAIDKYNGTESEPSKISWTEFSVGLLRDHETDEDPLIKDYQFKRIDVLFDPYLDPTGEGYHSIQSWITLGSGGLEGRGFMEGSQTRLNFILENHTDFVFASYAEYFGYVGTVFLLSLFGGISFLFLFSSLRNRDRYGSVAIGSIGFMFFLFYMINLSMVIGLIPVVGVPLPWISYGGSVALMLFLGLGYVQNAHINRPRGEEAD